MTVVLVHGNPETAAVWRPLVAELGRDDVVCLSPPGFGALDPAYVWHDLAQGWQTPGVGEQAVAARLAAGPQAGAELAGAELMVLEGLGHWWMVQDPVRGAAALERFWSALDGPHPKS